MPEPAPNQLIPQGAGKGVLNLFFQGGLFQGFGHKTPAKPGLEEGGEGFWSLSHRVLKGGLPA